MSQLHPESAPISSAFAALLDTFSTFVGIPGATDHPLGLEFEAGSHTARVMQHPADRGWLIVEVEVMSTEPASSGVYEALHRLNYAARLEHGWMATIGDDRMLVLHATRPIAAVTAADLEVTIVAGLERAEVLSGLWRNLTAGGGNTATSASEAAHGMVPHFPLIRG